MARRSPVQQDKIPSLALDHASPDDHEKLETFPSHVASCEPRTDATTNGIGSDVVRMGEAPSNLAPVSSDATESKNVLEL